MDLGDRVVLVPVGTRKPLLLLILRGFTRPCQDGEEETSRIALCSVRLFVQVVWAAFGLLSIDQIGSILLAWLHKKSVFELDARVIISLACSIQGRFPYLCDRSSVAQ